MSAPSMKMRPAVGRSKPASMRSSVVLPQPEAPSRQKNSLLVDPERDVVDGDEVAELLRDPVDAHVGLRIGIFPGLEGELRIAD